jgi:hypothetical protein
VGRPEPLAHRCGSAAAQPTEGVDPPAHLALTACLSVCARAVDAVLVSRWLVGAMQIYEELMEYAERYRESGWGCAGACIAHSRAIRLTRLGRALCAFAPQRQEAVLRRGR